VTWADDDESTRDWILAALVNGPRSIGDMAEEMFAEMDDAPAGETDRIHERLKKALGRMARDGWVIKSGTYGPRVTWSLRVSDGRK
jgi:hypothetical protein